MAADPTTGLDSYAYQYLVLVVFLVVATIFPLLPIVLSRIVAPRKPSQIKQDTYECGLESKGDAWVAFKAQYYVYALAFVAFDLEAPFVYVWAVVFKQLPVAVFFEMMAFIGVLVAGLIYCWKKGALDWE
jgi:NADH:ubiquinone oxidoreductase subunit 3 (subunit A)